MTTLKQIKGSAIQFLAEDPVVNTGPAGAWASGGNLNTARFQMSGAGVSVTSGLAFGGFESPGTPYSTKNESYDGTSFTEVADLNTGRRYVGGCGTQTAALASGNLNAPQGTFNEQWDGSSWTEVGDFNTNRFNFAQFGTTTAALAAGGETPAPPYQTANVETWNGSAWTEVGDLNSAKYANRGFGSTTAGLIFGGANTTPSTLAETESWNGSSWTEVNDLNTARYSMGSTVSAGQSSGQAMGGLNPGYAQTESWDGTNWTEVADMATGRGSGAGFGVSNSGVVAGGSTTASSPTRVTTTEEFTLTPSTASTLIEGQMWFNSSSSTLKGYGTAAGIPAATWASGTNFPSSTYGQSGFGTQTSAMIAGGPTALTNTFTYNGTSFSSQPALNTSSPPTARYFPGAFGADGTSGLIAGGEPGVAATETWDGSAWTEVADLNTGRNLQGSFGVVTAGIVAGGYTATADSADVESWNGSSWTELSNINTARNGLGGTGGQDNGIVFGGTNNAATETWDGSAWTEVSDLNTGRRFGGSYGSTTSNSSALFAGGYTTGPVANTESWNGSSWTEVNDLNTARRSYGQGGSSAAAVLVAGESPGGATNATEEFTATAGIATITTS